MAADIATLLFALLWGLGGAGGERETRPRPRPEPAPPPPPSSGPRPPPPPPSPQWPQVVPSGLPPFPGSGWEYDEPVPLVVQQRAGQLVSQLWARGAGAHKIEQTAGRWIAFQAAIVASGKKGVVAFRVKQARAAPSSPTVRRAPPQLPAPRSTPAPRPSPPAAPPRVNVQVGPATVLPSETRPTLRKGAGMGALEHQSPHVMYVQRVLGVAPIDGDFGPITFKAVDQFQRSNGLAVDGVVGRETWAALDRHPRARAMLQQARA